MSQLRTPTDSERDASKYRQWSLALEHACQQLQQIETNHDITIEDVLNELLVDMTEALDAERAFVARYHAAERNNKWLDLIALHPPEKPKETRLELSETFRSLLRDGRPKVIDPLGDGEVGVIPGLEFMQATAAILVRVETMDETYIVGICNKKDDHIWPFLAGDRMVLYNLLELVATGVRTGQRRRLEIESIRETLDALTSELDLDALLTFIVEKAAAVFQAAATTVLLWDDAEENLTVHAAFGLSNYYKETQRISHDTVKQLIRRQEGKRSPMVIKDLQKEPFGRPELIALEDLRSVLCAPLFVDSLGPRGALTIHSKGTTREFSAEEQNLAQSFADGAAIAIRNARYFQRRLEEQKALQQISEAAIQDTPEEVWQTITRNAVQLAQATHATLVRLDQKSGILRSEGTWFADGIGWHPEQWTLPLNDSSTSGRVAHSQQPEYARDLTDQTQKYVRLQDIHPYYEAAKSAYCVPLIVHGEALGTLYVGSDRLYGFDDVEVRQRIGAIAPHAAIALNNAQLWQEARQQQQLREQIIKIQTNIVNILDLDEQLEQLYANLSQAFECPGFFIATFDGKTQMINLPIIYHRGKRILDVKNELGGAFEPRMLNEYKGFADHIVEQRKSLLIEDFAKHALYQEIDPVYHKGMKSCLVVPMFRQNIITGVIGLWTHERIGAYREYDQQLLEALAPFAAIVIDNSREHDRRIKELEAVSRFQQQISELDVQRDADEEVLRPQPKGNIVTREVENIHTYAQQALGSVGILTHNMFMALLDENENMVTYPFLYEGGKRVAQKIIDNDDHYLLYRDRPLNVRPGLSQQMIRMGRREPLLFNRRADATAWAKSMGRVVNLPIRSQSWLGAPMVSRGKLIGVIGLRDFEREGCFEKRHGELLKTIADQATIAIVNARLYESAHDREHELGQANTIAVMGAWGAEIVHDVNRETGHIDEHVVQIQDMIDEHVDCNMGQIQEHLREIERSAELLTLPELPTQPPRPGRPLRVHDTSPLHDVIAAELTDQKAVALRPAGGTPVHLDFQPGKHNVKVAMHEQWLRRVLRHFVQNAVRYMPETRAKAVVIVRTRIEGDKAYIEVEDTGNGIAPHIARRLFRQPVTHKEVDVQERQGRGLLLVDFVMKMHGGDARLARNRYPNQGACFEFCVPIPA